MKNYRSWLNESSVSVVSEPDSLEMRMGNIKTSADPKSDGWAKELVRLKEYVDFSTRLKAALDSNNDSELRVILDQVKDMPLFKSEQEGGWQRLQINGQEFTKDSVENRKKVARYIINKIAEIKDWHEKT